MILLPILLPVLMGLMIGVALLVWLGAVMFSMLVTGLVSSGASVVSAHGRRRAESREEAAPRVVAMPTASTEVEDWPEAA